MAKKPAAPRSTKTVAASAGHAQTPATAGAAVPAMDYVEHESTYHRFTFLVRWAIIISVIGMILLYIIINPMIRPAG